MHEPLFEPILIPLVGVNPSSQPGFATRDPIPALYHCAEAGQHKALVYIPGGVPGMPLCGGYDYNILAARLREISYSLIVPQMSASQKPASNPLEDCVGDIQSVLAGAKDNGFDHLAMAGNGLGAARMACWTARAFEICVESVIFLSPCESPYLAIERDGSSDRQAQRDRVLKLCGALKAAGRGQEIVEANLDGGRRAFTADGFVDCFGPPGQASAEMIRFTGEIGVPTCIIHGDRDPIAPPGGADAVLESLMKAPTKKLIWITGGDHHLLSNPTTVESTCRVMCDWLTEKLHT